MNVIIVVPRTHSSSVSYIRWLVVTSKAASLPTEHVWRSKWLMFVLSVCSPTTFGERVRLVVPGFYSNNFTSSIFSSNHKYTLGRVCYSVVKSIGHFRQYVWNLFLPVIFTFILAYLLFFIVLIYYVWSFFSTLNNRLTNVDSEYHHIIMSIKRKKPCMTPSPFNLLCRLMLLEYCLFNCYDLKLKAISS